MLLKDIIPDSTLAIIGTITPDYKEKLNAITIFNERVYNRFENVFVVCNMAEGIIQEQVNDYCKIWKEIVPHVDIYLQPINRFHMLGTIDLDEKCLEYCETKYLWKSTDDVIIEEVIFDKEVKDGSEFMYLPSFSYKSLMNGSGKDKWASVPQTNFFILDTATSCVESLYGPDVEWKWEEYLEQKKRYPDLKPWEVPFQDGIKFACEEMLGYNTSNLWKYCLLSDEAIERLVRHVMDHKEPNPAHPNIMLTEVGICHYHRWKEGVYHV